MKAVTAKSAIAGRRAQRAQLHPQVLAQQGGERGHPSSSTKSAASVAAAALMADHQAGATIAGGDQGSEPPPRVGVEMGVGLIEQEQRRLVQDGAADVDPLLHPG